MYETDSVCLCGKGPQGMPGGVGQPGMVGEKVDLSLTVYMYKCFLWFMGEVVFICWRVLPL